MLPYSCQTIEDDDIAAVTRALISGNLTSGSEVWAFESEFAAAVGSKHAVALCNGTAALHLALVAAGIGKGDRVITSPNTFVASANCAAFVGAVPDFCDIDPVSYSMDPASLESAWTLDIKAVIPVSYAGQSADMPAIARIARERGAIVVEDACHGVGGGFAADGRVWKLGGHPWADITIFSFHPVKPITTGEGGMLVTDNDEIARRVRLLRSHGLERDPSQFSTDEDCWLTREKGPWFYEMQELGYNYRITDIQCALGRSQLKKLPRLMERRREIVGIYNEAFQDLPYLRTPGLRNPTDSQHISWHLYTVQIDFESVELSRAEFMNILRKHGVGTQVLYIPVYLQPWYRNTYNYAPGRCPIAEKYYTRALSLPLFPSMLDSDVERVCATVVAVLSKEF